MKKQILLCLFLGISSLVHSQKLQNTMLQSIDQAGFFDRAIVDIIKIRQKVKDLVQGKLIWHGAKINLKTTVNHYLTTLIKRVETIQGVTFIVLPPTHPDILKFTTQEHKDDITKYLKNIKSKNTLDRQNHTNFDGYFTGSYAFHPITEQKLPIFVADYAPESFISRNNYAHLAVPAHITKDFTFAQKHNLPIKSVIVLDNEAHLYNNSQTTKEPVLTQAFIKNDDEVTVIHSDFLNGNPKQASDKAIQYLQEHKIGTEYKSEIVYDFYNKQYSLENLKAIEESLDKENIALSHEQKQTFAIIMNYIQADLLDIVEPFLINIRTAKDLMVELIEESCTLRKNQNSYIRTWSQVSSEESEQAIFKRDITTFQALRKFCLDMVDFLGDFASSCPHALDNLKRLKK